jgi:histone-lysine N-methyltransferase SETD1
VSPTPPSPSRHKHPSFSPTPQPPPPFPPRCEYASSRDFKVIFDPLVDKDHNGRLRSLISKLRTLPRTTTNEERVKETKGKEILFRFGGEVAANEGEAEVDVRDPRIAPGFKRMAKPPRGEFHQVHYEVFCPHLSLLCVLTFPGSMTTTQRVHPHQPLS